MTAGRPQSTRRTGDSDHADGNRGREDPGGPGRVDAVRGAPEAGVGKPLEWVPGKSGRNPERRTENESGHDCCRQPHGCKPDHGAPRPRLRHHLQRRRGSAGRIVARPSSSTSTTYRPASAPLVKRLRPFGRREMIAWVSVRVSTT